MSCYSTTFKRGKRSLSPFEAELAGIHWAITKEHYFTRGAPRIIVVKDAQSMGGFLSQDLEKIENSRAQAMVEELQPYSIEVHHVPGPKMEFLDHGSCHPISYGQHKVFDAEAGSSVGSLLNETKCHLVSFSLVANQTKWHLVWSFPN